VPSATAWIKEKTLVLRLLRPVALLASVATIAMAALADPAGAVMAANVEIRGVGTFVPEGAPECRELDDLYTIRMTGSLEGCWYTTVLNVVQDTSSGIYQERGEETFIGCLVENGLALACGTFDTTYHFTAKYAPDGSELHGRCHHPIVDGTGDFADATGRVDFKDDVVTGEFDYRGHIKLP
jgi:hypothetical protein